jgi:hypothetical protein
MIRKGVQNNLHQPRYAFVAPFLRQAKLIAWEPLKHYSKVLPGYKANESELYVEFMVSGSFCRIYLFGADNPDAIRGAYWDGVILDEYAQIKPEIWSQIFVPALSDRNGWAVFSGTPKGQNHFLEILQKAQKAMAEGNPLWWSAIYSADTTSIFTKEQLEEFASIMSDSEFRQEYLCDFTASSDNILITLDKVLAAQRKIYLPRDVMMSARVMGVDVARFGGDRSPICKRQGLQVYPLVVYKGIDNMALAARVANEIDDFKPDAVFVDAGRGEGVIDRLHQLGYNEVIEVNFGSTAIDDKHYENRRSEMWDNARKWLDSGGALPQDDELKTDLTTPMYEINTRNRMELESKKSIKQRLGKSPDLGDSFALTFAHPVRAKSQEELCADRGFAKHDYNINSAFVGRENTTRNKKKTYVSWDTKGSYDPYRRRR